ncbi:MAG TPA: hypothetical protein VM008_01015 [Phycisphaerae bacterium]|nr:hypothetical protein [Phycisphaerae bacterium]
MKKFLQFKTIVWALAIAAGVWIAAGPLIENAWAQMMWQRTPCWVPAGGKAFFYEAGGQRYISSHLNFWTRIYNTDPVVTDTLSPGTVSGEQPNDFCWVSSRDPKLAVLRLDAASHLDQGTSRYASAALLIAAVAIMTTFGGKRRSS